MPSGARIRLGEYVRWHQSLQVGKNLTFDFNKKVSKSEWKSAAFLRPLVFDKTNKWKGFIRSTSFSFTLGGPGGGGSEMKRKMKPISSGHQAGFKKYRY